MSEQHLHQESERLDDLFRNSLGDLQTEPSTGVWKRIDRRLLRSELGRFHFSNVPGKAWLAIPAALLITAAILFFTTGDKEQTSPKEETALPPAREIMGTGQTLKEDITSVSPAGDKTVDVPSPSSPEQNIPPSIETVPATQAISSVTLEETLPAAPEPASPVPFMNLILPGDLVKNPLSTRGMSAVPNPVPRMTFYESPQKTLPRSLALGLNITPDMVFYQSPSSSFKYNYTFDLGAQYSIGKFFLASGLGITYSTDIGTYAIRYLKNDSVGFYYSIISFDPDPGNPGHTVYETKQVTVYDSVEYSTDQSTKNRYLYLQIPLSVGYRFLDKPAWRLSAEGGLYYNYLISLKEPAPAFYMSESRILDIRKESPGRNRNSFGVMCGVRVEYRFTRNFYLLIEPTFRYAIQAVDESSRGGAKQPYSVGLRAGIWYMIDYKNKTK
jgi:hypothetical protein